MKSYKGYKEMTRCVLEARDEYLRKKKKRQLYFKRSVPAVLSFCFIAVLLSFNHGKVSMPRIPEQSAVIEEPVTEIPVSIIATDILTTIHSDKQTEPVTTTKSVKGSETGRSTLTITTVTSDTTLSVKSSETDYSASTGTNITHSDTETESARQTETTIKALPQTQTEPITTNNTETTVKDPPQTQTEPITTNHTETTSIYQTTAATTDEKIEKSENTTTALSTQSSTNNGQTTTTTVITKPDERIILAIENTDYSRSISEFKNGEKYKYTGNYMKVTDISGFEYIDSFRVYYYFGPIQDEMSSVYKVYTVPNEEDKAAVQIDNSDFFLFFEKCIQE